jgi:lipopolysaccharide/colanic/teichoic acid biosynthesis glycosyltransferase
MLRFLFLQISLTWMTIWYFDNFLIGDYIKGYDIIIYNLREDRLRFYNFLNYDFVKIDIYLAIFVFLFLTALYTSNFYSYVNELAFSTNKGLFDEFFSIYLIWTASYLSFLQIFRFTAVSRAYLILFTLIVPIFLVLFRNSELISKLLGRNPSKETYISFNLKKDSLFRELRLVSLRKNLESFENPDQNDFSFYKRTIENFNKENSINIVIFNLENINNIPKEFEAYLLNLNKKILIIADQDFKFNNFVIMREEEINDKKIIYLNTDIQYGSRYIIKRVLDITISILLMVILSPILLATALYIYFLDGRPIVLRQLRVGLHGDIFSMFKFRTMKNNSHNERTDLEALNEHSGPLFKIKNDPRILYGASNLRRFSIDELPQIFNVLKGNMSLVGPRPLFPEDSKHFDEHYLRRLNVLPGITGLLQINERNTNDFNIWYKYDIEYIEKWSILLDLKIILLTPAALFSKRTSGE